MTGTLLCLKCAQSVDADSFSEADVIINHAATSKQCSGDLSYMRWDGEPLTDSIINAKSTITVKTTTTSRKKSK